jgi:hypothetical protein
VGHDRVKDDKVGNLFIAIVRVGGAFMAIAAGGLAISAIVQMVNQEPFGAHLIGAIFAGIVAALGLSVRDE